MIAYWRRRRNRQIVIMELSMPVRNGIEAASEIRQEPGTPIILLTVHSEDARVRSAFESGISGYVLKSKAASELLQAIHEVNRGNIYLSPGISNAVIRDMLRRRSGADNVLTQRERQVLQLIALGRTAKEVSQMLGVSVGSG